jgi:hypothetical protein
VIIPGALREQFADEGIIASHYDSAKKWMDYMSGFVKDGIIARDSYGDWCVPPEDPKLIHSNDPKRKTDKALLATVYFYHDAKLMAGYAIRLGNAEDARHFTELAEKLKAAFNAKFFHADTGQYDNGSQTSCVLPLAFGLVPEGERERVFNHLVRKITDETQGHIGTGLIGGQWLMRVLTAGGRADLAYTIASQKTYPSWGYMVEQGATTIWELWNGNTADPAMNSGNHVMLVGDLGIWLYENLAGIKPDPEQPGFKHIIMRPEPVGDLQFVKASHRSPYGLIASDWQKQGDVFRWNQFHRDGLCAGKSRRKRQRGRQAGSPGERRAVPPHGTGAGRVQRGFGPIQLPEFGIRPGPAVPSREAVRSGPANRIAGWAAHSRGNLCGPGLDFGMGARHSSPVNRDLEPNRGGRIPFLANLLILLWFAWSLPGAQTNDFLNDTRGGHWLAQTRGLGIWWCESGWKVGRERALPEPTQGKPKPVSVSAGRPAAGAGRPVIVGGGDSVAQGMGQGGPHCGAD